MTLTTDDDSSKVQARGDTVVNDGSWHHITGVFNGSNMTIYVDGVFDGSMDSNSSYNFVTPQLVMSHNAGTYADFNGSLDEVMIFDRELTASQISTLFTNQQSGNNYDGGSRTCQVCVVPRAEYLMNECQWNGTLDEVQDTNGVQIELAMRLRNGNTRVIGIGDRFQSIYAFRGASIVLPAKPFLQRRASHTSSQIFSSTLPLARFV